MSRGYFPSGHEHRGVCGNDFSKSLQLCSLCLRMWRERRTSRTRPLGLWVGLKANVPRVLPSLVSSRSCSQQLSKSFIAVGNVWSRNLDLLCHLWTCFAISLATRWHRCKGGGTSAVQSGSCDCAAPPLWFLWCLIKHLVYFEAI